MSGKFNEKKNPFAKKIFNLKDERSHQIVNDCESDFKDNRMKTEDPLYSDVSEREKTIKILIQNFFSCKKSTTAFVFVGNNLSLLSKLYSKTATIFQNPYESFYKDDYARYVLSDINKKYKNFIHAAGNLETPEYVRIIVDEVIPQIEDGIKTENELEERKMFRKFFGHFIWLLDFREKYEATLLKKGKEEFIKSLRPLCHQTAEYFKTDEFLWWSVERCESLCGRNADEPSDFLKKGLEHCPDSIKLILTLAYFECKKGANTKWRDQVKKIQEFSDRLLISYADNGFDIKPLEWINQAVEFVDGMNDFKSFDDKFVSAIEKSILGLCDRKDIEKIFKEEIYSRLRNNHRMRKLQYFSNNKRLWVHMTFHEEMFDHELKLLLKLACENCPNDASLRNLIQARRELNQRKFVVAQRLFNKVNGDPKWTSLIVEKYSQFQVEVKELRSERYNNVLNHFIEMNPSRRYSKSVSDIRVQSYLSYGKSPPLHEWLQDEWLLGERELMKILVEKYVLRYPDDRNIRLMKGHIEIKHGKFDKAAETFENAIKSTDYHQHKDYYLKLAELSQRREDFLKAEKVLQLGISRETEYFSVVRLWIALIRLKLRTDKKTEAQTLLNQAIEKNPKSGELWAEAICMEERSDRGKKAAAVLTNFGDYNGEAKYVMLAAAKFFFNQGEVKKCRKWFNKTVEKYPKFNDAWIFFYKLEKIYGTEESAREMLIRYILTALEYEDEFSLNEHGEYGEKWEAFKDHIDNWTLTAEELLEASVMKKNIDIKDI